MPASIRRVGDDVSVSVSPERLVKKAERGNVKKGEAIFPGSLVPLMDP